MPQMQMPGFQPASQIEPGELESLISDVLTAKPLCAEAELANTAPVKWEPKQLNARHREIMRRLLEGANYRIIAEEMGIHVQTVMLVATSKLFISELSKMEADADFNVIKRAEALSHEALDTLKNLMRFGKSELARKSSADSILDRAGYAKVEKKLIGIVNGEDVIMELNRQRRESILGANGSTNGNTRARTTSVTSDVLDTDATSSQSD
mgnify:FL=1